MVCFKLFLSRLWFTYIFSTSVYSTTFGCNVITAAYNTLYAVVLVCHMCARCLESYYSIMSIYYRFVVVTSIFDINIKLYLFNNWSYSLDALLSTLRWWHYLKVVLVSACPLTVKHILVDCVDLNDARNKHFVASSIKHLFENVEAQNIIDFIK